MAFLYRRSGDLAFGGLISKIHHVPKSPMDLGWERGGSKRNKGFYLIKTFLEVVFIKPVPLYRSIRFKRFSPT